MVERKTSKGPSSYSGINFIHALVIISAPGYGSAEAGPHGIISSLRRHRLRARLGRTRQTQEEQKGVIGSLFGRSSDVVTTLGGARPPEWDGVTFEHN